MCGIVGYVGKHKAAPLILEGLKRLEYRGYDSAGVAVWHDGKFTIAKKAGRVANLEKETARMRLTGNSGMGHTRWATHGGVTDANAHPHLSSDGQIALIHNGVIENFNSMKKFLLTKGYQFLSETDTEVLCNLIAYHYAKEPVNSDESRFVIAVRKTLLHVEGTYGIVVMALDAPGELVTARKGSPLILGIGDGESLVASDVSAIVSRTQSVVYLNDGEVAHLTPQSFSITTLNAGEVSPVVDQVTWAITDAELNGYTHFM
ncbi:MAG: class II glutamine amidotransferase [Candidatus Didemnitutus sp.]|nr:class II glutamine amidotransferase [Candidatus Didemnitutus sp.]